MNEFKAPTALSKSKGFRPQQGLTIMNIYQGKEATEILRRFPSPTGVNYYELISKDISDFDVLFPSPTGVNYYE